MVGGMTEATTLLNEVAKDNICAVKKEQKKIENKANPCHADHVQMDTLDDSTQLCADCDEEIQHANNEIRMNAEIEDATRGSECAIEIDTDHSSQSQELRSPSTDSDDSCEDSHIDKEDSISYADECPSDFEE